MRFSCLKCPLSAQSSKLEKQELVSCLKETGAGAGAGERAGRSISEHCSASQDLRDIDAAVMPTHAHIPPGTRYGGENT